VVKADQELSRGQVGDAGMSGGIRMSRRRVLRGQRRGKE
jgi:hypothetical protein